MDPDVLVLSPDIQPESSPFAFNGFILDASERSQLLFRLLLSGFSLLLSVLFILLLSVFRRFFVVIVFASYF